MDTKLNGANGMKPRKAMASGDSMPTGDFGVAPLAKTASHGPRHNSEDTMKRGPRSDGDRAGGAPIKHTRGMMPAQAAADHGPHRPEGGDYRCM